jgi:hypothetical protein
MKRPSIAEVAIPLVASQQGGAMLSRALLVILIAGATIDLVAAQFGGAPGLPEGAPGAPFVQPPAANSPPEHCRELLALRDELQKHGTAISAANEKGADVKVACRLFRSYIVTEYRLLQAMDAHGGSCGVPKEIYQQVRSSHAKAQQIGKQVCDAAARGSAPSRPTLYDRFDNAPPATNDMPFLYDGLWPPNRRP